MTVDTKTPPRRWKLPSELAGDESGKVETDPYVRWRRDSLKVERDDLELRERLLREEAGALGAKSSGIAQSALEAISAEDHFKRVREGREREPVAPPESAQSLDAQAAALIAEADEIHQHRADGAEPSAAEFFNEMRSNR